MIYDRYYYSCLTQEQKQIYKLIYGGLQSFRRQIAIPRSGNADIYKIISAINFDNPHLFFVCFEKVRVSESQKECIYYPEYYFSKPKATQLWSVVQGKARAILQQIQGAEDYEKEVCLHDLLVQNIAYDEKAKSDLSRMPYSSTVLGVLLQKLALCEGIAKAVKLLLNCLGIKCLIAQGNLLAEKQNGHAWNIVKLYGKSVHLDVTNDLDLQGKGNVHHTFLNLTDAQIEKTHTMQMQYPVCMAEEYDYFIRNNLSVADKKDLERVLLDAYRNKARCAEFRLDSSWMIDEKTVMRSAMQTLLRHTALRAVRIMCCMNKEQGVVVLRW